MPTDLVVNLIKLPKYKDPEDIVIAKCEYIVLQDGLGGDVNVEKLKTKQKQKQNWKMVNLYLECVNIIYLTLEKPVNKEDLVGNKNECQRWVIINI